MEIQYIKLNKQNNIVKENIKENKLNYGLAILKAYLSFKVIIIHFFKINSTNNKIILNIVTNKISPVPSFFIISFYFMCNNLLSLKFKLLLKRLERLLIPYIIWPNIMWVVNTILKNKYDDKNPYTFEILKLQLLYGHMYMAQFWFLWNLIIMTIIYYLIIFVFRKNSLFIFHLLLLISYQLQYSGYIYNHFFVKFPYYNRYTISRFFGMLPLSVTGYTLGIFKIINIIQQNRTKSLIFSVIIYKMINNYKIFASQPGIIYYGVNLNIIAICIIFIFSLFHSDKIRNHSIQKLIIFLTKYSGGIFYLHISIGKLLRPYCKDIRNGTFFGIIINYNICYFICFFGMIFFRNTSLKYLFI